MQKVIDLDFHSRMNAFDLQANEVEAFLSKERKTNNHTETIVFMGCPSESGFFEKKPFAQTPDKNEGFHDFSNRIQSVLETLPVIVSCDFAAALPFVSQKWIRAVLQIIT